MTNLDITDKQILINDFINFIKNSNNFNEEPTIISKKAYNSDNSENSEKTINPKWYLYCDIETFRFNLYGSILEGTPKATKNATWIVQIAYFECDNDMPSWVYFKDFREFLNIITVNCCKELKNYDIVLVFHNGYKYDNHFLKKELVDTLHLTLYNIVSEKATDNTFLKDIKDNEIKTVPTNYKEKDRDYVTVSAIKASTSNGLTFSYKGLYFTTEDSFLKTNLSLEKIGQKCLDMKILTEEYIKNKKDIDFNNLKYNIGKDLNTSELEKHKAYLLGDLSESEFKYVRNDVIVLAMCHKYFSDLFYGFSWDEFTFSGNVKKEYEKNGYYKALTNFQLTKKTPKGLTKHNKYKEKQYKIPDSLTLADKELAGWDSAETFFRQFYRGGLNLYNESYIGQIIEPEQAGFSMDLNSSYPTVMFSEKIPTYLVEGSHWGRMKRIPKDQNYFYMFKVSPKSMDKLLDHVKSRVIRQMFVKYYPVRNDGYVYINSVALNTLEKFMGGKRIQNLSYECCYKWKCEDFGARNVIKDNYYIKQHGKSKFEFVNVLNKQPFDPLHIVVDETVKNNDQKTPEEVQASKVLLNGIYGIPAMRPTFPQYVYKEDGSYLSSPVGHKNQERNVVFSVGVTAFAFRNLIRPLTFLTPEEIDKFFWYCDTDSLYFDGAVRDKIVKEHKEIFDPNNLGCWDLEHTNIVKFYILNHKKYALYDTNDKKPLTIHAGGVPKETFEQWRNECTSVHNDSQALNMLKDNYFKNGTKITVKRSILTNYGTVDIYDCESTLQDGLHDGKKTKHYLNSYEECKAYVKKEIDIIGKHFDTFIQDFDEHFSDVNADPTKSVLAEIPIDGYCDYVSYDGLIAAKKYFDGVERPKYIDKVSNKDKKEDIKHLIECDSELIRYYNRYRTCIDWQGERLQALTTPKKFNNLKNYFGCEYLAKEISDGVYLTYDLRVIRKDTLKEYKIDLENMAVRFNKQKYFVFTEYVRLFFNFTFNDRIDSIEKFLDSLIYDNYPKDIVENTQLYKDMKILYKGRTVRNPENETYKNKKYVGYRVSDLSQIYQDTWSKGVKRQVQNYIDNVNRKNKNEKKDPKNGK